MAFQRKSQPADWWDLDDRPQALVPAFSRPRDNAELLPQAQLVKLDPAFHHLSAGDAMDENLRYGHVVGNSGGRSDVLQATFVCSASCAASDYLVPFGDLILSGDMEIGEGGADHGNVPFFAFEAGRLAVRGIVVEVHASAV
jgi:hypothetical protein